MPDVSTPVEAEVMAAMAGLMQQLAVIQGATTDAERESQYDVLAGMLTAITPADSSTSSTAASSSAAVIATPGATDAGRSSTASGAAPAAATASIADATDTSQES